MGATPSKKSSRPVSRDVLLNPLGELQKGQALVSTSVPPEYHLFMHTSHPIIVLQHPEVIMGGFIIIWHILHLKASFIRFFNSSGTFESFVSLSKENILSFSSKKLASVGGSSLNLLEEEA